LAAANDLQLVSMYAGGILHTADWPAIVDGIVQKALWMKPHGTRIVVVNPDPIEWGKPLAKDDGQLRLQLRAIKKLGADLSREGMALAYHTHDPEMLHGAREFHHMLMNTDPAEVGLCLDTHWVWRGCGNSQVALDDLIGLYGQRIRSLHLRQSHDGVWDEVFGEGDISHVRLVACLKSIGFEGPLLLEQAYEEGTPTALEPIETHRHGKNSIQKIFSL
jgi:inosose dehydratase